MFARRTGPTRSRILATFAACSMALVSCRRPAVTVAPVAPPPAPPPKRAPEVLDVWSAADRAWVYADGRRLPDVCLPALMKAAGELRADAAVGIAALSTACGYQPLLSFDELWIQLAFEPGKRKPGWTAVFRMQQPPEVNLRC